MEPVSLVRLIMMIWPAYGILVFSLFVSWKLRSAPAVVTVAALTASLAGVMGGVGLLKARTASMRFEARTGEHVAARKKMGKARSVAADNAQSTIASLVDDPRPQARV